MKENEKIVLGWIDSGVVTSGFAGYISQLLLHRSDIISGVAVGSGSYLSSNRNTMAKTFLETSDADWLLSLDSDLLIHLDSFDALIDCADSDKYDIVAGKYYIPLSNGVELAAQKHNPEIPGGGMWMDAKDPDLNKKVIDKLHSVGAGYMLVHRRVFETILKDAANPMPWFQDYWLDYPYESWATDDIHFCNLVNRYNFNIALCTNATSIHLKTASISDSTFLQFHEYNKWIKEKNYKSEKTKSWWVRGK